MQAGCDMMQADSTMQADICRTSSVYRHRLGVLDIIGTMQALCRHDAGYPVPDKSSAGNADLLPEYHAMQANGITCRLNSSNFDSMAHFRRDNSFLVSSTMPILKRGKMHARYLRINPAILAWSAMTVTSCSGMV